MRLDPGTRLGPYEITIPPGAGGMDDRLRRAFLPLVLLLLPLLPSVSCRSREEKTAPAPPVGTGGGAPEAAGAAATPAADPPTLEELRNATYRGLDVGAGMVALVDGRWEGKPFAESGVARDRVDLVRNFRIIGDLDRDGDAEAAVLLSKTSGGSGVFTYLAILDPRNGALVNAGTAPLGDRVQVRSARIEPGRVIVDLVQPGKGDAACCPGDLATRAWTLEPEGLEESGPPTATGRLSLATIDRTEWVLRSWSSDEAAPPAPEITLFAKQGRFTGSAGCNRYLAATMAGRTPGEIMVEISGTTRRACPEPETAAERRFLEQLAAVKRFGFMAGQLALTYGGTGTAGVMLFERIAVTSISQSHSGRQTSATQMVLGALSERPRRAATRRKAPR